jgi:SAM-dependent methyltransferase
MTAPSLSVVVPQRHEGEADALRGDLVRYLDGTGLTYELLLPDEHQFGASVRRAIADSRGSVVVVVTPGCEAIAAIGDAMTLIESGSADAVFATTREQLDRWRVTRALLVPLLADPSTGVMAFSSAAAKLCTGESKLVTDGWPFEVSFLLNKYGFRVETVLAQAGQCAVPGALARIAAAFRIRRHDRRLEYRAARRCPVCFSPDVWSCGQVPGNVIRECHRCRCRYLNTLAETESAAPVRRNLEAHPEPAASHEAHSDSAREKTSARRMSGIRGVLAARSRLLEIGIRDGSFGALACREHEYVGIDRAHTAVRNARARGLEAYCASLSNFVNTGPAFDAVALYHVFESMADPHDSLARIKDLLKPGGVLFLTAFDTEGFLYVLTESSGMATHFRSHLILYSRSALIELLERSGFEIVSVAPDFVYRDHRLLRHWLAHRSALVGALGRMILAVTPDPLLVTSGSINIVARRRAGHNFNRRAIRSAEATHVR